MLTLNSSEELSEEIIKVLRKYIEGITPAVGFKEIFNEWPAGNFTFDHPSLTILTVANPEYRANMNKPIKNEFKVNINQRRLEINFTEKLSKEKREELLDFINEQIEKFLQED